MQILNGAFVKWIPIANTLTIAVAWIRNPRDKLCQRMPENKWQNKHKDRNPNDKRRNPDDSVEGIPKLLQLGGVKQPELESE